MPGLEVTTNFFLVLTLLADAVVVATAVFGLACAVSPGARRAWRSTAAFLGPQSLLLAWIVSIVTTAGSLWYSEHFHFLPCELCWYQRILMYPLVVVLGVGWFRRDKAVWITAAPFLVFGPLVSLYHWLVERVPSFAEGTSCSIDAPCSTPYFEKLGFVTLAWMALSGFLLVGSLLAFFVTASRSEVSAEDTARAAADPVGTVSA
jgi:disulfide bond formation protein DsbB